MTRVLGTDVSFWQDEPSTPEQIDFVKMKQGADFTIIRAGQNLWADPDWAYNWRESKAAGLPRGSYWFYDSRAEPKKQAELWVQTMGTDLGELPLFADFEESYNGTYKGWQNWYVFLERIRALVGPQKEIGIYTAFYYWRDNAPNATTQAANLEYFKRYPLWIAHYGAEKPMIPKPWGEEEWLLWQFTAVGDGRAFGVESLGIDLNYFNGDLPAFKARFNLNGQTGPDPIPTPGSGLEVNAQYALNLNTRQGPAETFPVNGNLRHADPLTVESISQDGKWVQVRRSGDNLSGWVNLDFFVRQASTPPPGPTPVEEWYRVTSSALNVRSGPSTTYPSVFFLQQGDVVKVIGYSPDRAWLQLVKTDDGQTGWAYGAYLTKVDGPPPPPPPAPEEEWYKVIATTLHVRSGPASTFPPINYLQKDDIIKVIGYSADKSWMQIERIDGLVGWSFGSYLTKVGNAMPASLNQKLFPGVTYFRKEITSPRRMVAHVLGMDLGTPDMNVFVTPSTEQTGILCSRTTSQFLQEFKMQVAINGDGFTYLPPGTHPPNQYCPDNGEPLRTNGFAASRGKIYNEKQTGQPIVYSSVINEITFNRPKGSVYHAISGDRMLVFDGKPISTLVNDIANPRTAVGLNKAGKFLLFVVVDGRQPGYSEGATYTELASLMISLGAYTAVNMDGGGSSAMVIQGIDKKPRVLNRPIDSNTPGKERAVANHLGVFLNK